MLAKSSGVQFIEAGDRFRLLLRVCRYGREAQPGLRAVDQGRVVRLDSVRIRARTPLRPGTS
jgi:hypothetical protein